ncbi:MAG: UDP-N-acetylmuramoyl-L-alanine--D-glutamate ligase [Clostridia bacterium]|nr:UDP-N-acetylmuramoyl-L-alanine--D-glutamate ligase [Clostridia bacterium]
MKRALIVGSGKSGKGATKLLKKLGYMIYVTDDKQRNLKGVYGDGFLRSLSLIVLSPGIPPNHRILEIAKTYGIDHLCEFELGVLELSCPCVMITGTNGKTTTTLLVHKLLENSGFGVVHLGGNVGIPVSSFAKETAPQDIAILEASSFQLEYKKRSSPHVAVLLNLAPDHISWHGSMESYVRAKLKIFEGQTNDDFAVLNADDELVMRLAKNLQANVYYFSTKSRVKGCFAESGCIYFSDGISTSKVANTSDLKILGEHNLQNALAGVLVSILLGQDFEKIRKNLAEFVGVSHRLEWIKDVDGVSFFNDSKATNPHSTITAMNSMQTDTTIILGGSDKGNEFDEIFLKAPDKIKNFVCLGETKPKLLESAKRCKATNVFEADTMKQAVHLAFNLSKNGDAVLLSPACASFDMFSSYEERGKVFTKIVRGLEKHEDKLKRKTAFKAKNKST